MQSNSLTTGLYASVELLPARHSIPVVEGTLAVVDTLVAADDTLAPLGILAVVDIPVVADGTLVARDILVVDILEAASAALQIPVVAAQLGLPVSQAPLQVLLLPLLALQALLLPLAVRMVAPGCS